MTRPDHLEDIGLVGGTGPLGKGLAVRWARAGHAVRVGSRTSEKAERVAAEVQERAGGDVTVDGVTNGAAAERSDVVAVTVPYEAQEAVLPPLRTALAGKVVVNVVNPMTFDDVGPLAVPVEAGSAAEECQQLLPGARVVSAFHDVPATRLWNVDEAVGCDVLICGDDEEANHLVAHLAARIPGMWGVDCGPLRNSAHIENMTPVLLSINRRYGIHAAIRIDGLTRDDASLHTAQR